MNYKRKETSVQSASTVALREHATAERCHCQPLSLVQAIPLHEQDEEEMDCEKITPASPELNTSVRTQLSTFFPRSTALSILLLHVSQLEHIHIAPPTAILHKRLRFHAPASFLEQVLTNMRRTIRENDQILMHKGVGAAIIFPDVDQQGIFDILERVYRNISLLQAETVIPPLKRETDIVIGVASYPEAGPSLEHLLHHASLTARRFTMRPAITTQLWKLNSNNSEEETAATSTQLQGSHDLTQTAPRLGKIYSNVPFMQLPVQLPSRLKQLIPYQVANELRCAPVGRDHHCLTVAMVDPTNSAIIHTLHELTGLTIYPVSCDLTALNALLANKW